MSAKFDKILGVVREQDEGGGGGGSTQTISGSSVTIAQVAKNTVYNFTDDVEALTVTAVENSASPSTLMFRSSGTGVVVALPDSLYLTETLTFYPNCRYALNIQNNIATLQELTSAAEMAQYGTTPHNLTADNSDPRYTLSASSCGWKEDWTGKYQYYNAMDALTDCEVFKTSDYDSNAYWQICFNEGYVDLYSVTVQDSNSQCIVLGSFDGGVFTEVATTNGAPAIIHSLPFKYWRIQRKSDDYGQLSFSEIEFRYKVNSGFIYYDSSPITFTQYTTSFKIIAYGSGTLTYSAVGLPAGLSINSATGVISGTFPSTNFTFSITVASTSGKSKTSQISATRVDASGADASVVKVEITTPGTTCTFSTIKGAVTIVWGDGASTVNDEGGTHSFSHTYAAAGQYYIILTGSYTGVKFDGMASTLIEVAKITNNLDGSVGSMFSNCSRITSMPLFDTSRFTDFSFMFIGCSSIRSYPAFNTSNVTNFAQVCDGCNSLTAIPNWDYSEGTDINRGFKGGVLITGTADASKFWNRTPSWSNSSSCFESCTKISNYSSIPSGWK